jgi:hypothetical protein
MPRSAAGGRGRPQPVPAHPGPAGREHYLVEPLDGAATDAEWRTDICWPVLRLGVWTSLGGSQLAGVGACLAAQGGQFAVDTAVAPLGFSFAYRSTGAVVPFGTVGRPGRLCG